MWYLASIKGMPVHPGETDVGDCVMPLREPLPILVAICSDCSSYIKLVCYEINELKYQSHLLL